MHFRLPTEAEWEFTARAGTTTPKYWGDATEDACKYGSVSDPTAKNKFGFAWRVHNCEDGYEATAPVGSFNPNGFGIYDMLGNVWEWTCSEYKETYDGSEQTCTGKAARYVLRGGSWSSGTNGVRAARRISEIPDFRIDSLGFRLARDK